MKNFLNWLKKWAWFWAWMLLIIATWVAAYQFTSYLDVPDAISGQTLTKDGFNQVLANVRDLNTKVNSIWSWWDIICPAWFTSIGSWWYQLWCLRNTAQWPTACNTAISNCFNLYWWILPSYDMAHIAFNSFALNLTDEKTNYEWVDWGLWDGWSPWNKCSTIAPWDYPSWRLYDSTAYYRCFIPR
ncbi:MAG: hypothetical protein ACD_3C00111G0013 [uncultured bacterium (gcode 4)]|uniref:Uncharacterized protein n=1 Tax=uncultured bacterium (gcode 4) TaxID=1234023 RepID=K2FA35_9BACT|nr:MAG: hypothetical protein ACD_3C00111G0013 [uncultured bacterium (gcode 4)]